MRIAKDEMRTTCDGCRVAGNVVRIEEKGNNEAYNSLDCE